MIGMKLVMDIWHSSGICPNCGESTNFYLTRVKEVEKFLFIPIFQSTSKRMDMCVKCKYYVDMSRKDYKKAIREQTKKLFAHQFPPEIVLADYDSMNLHFPRKIFGVAVSCFLAYMVIYSSIYMITDFSFDVSSILVSIFLFLPMGGIPLTITTMRLVKALKLKKIYNYTWAKQR
jgi:hypothetical protein